MSLLALLQQDFGEAEEEEVTSGFVRVTYLGYMNLTISVMLLFLGVSMGDSLLFMTGLGLELLVISYVLFVLDMDRYHLRVTSEMSSTVVQAERFVVMRVEVSNYGNDTVRGAVRVKLPPSVFLASDPSLVTLIIDPSEKASVNLLLRATVRGKIRLGTPEFVRMGFIGLCEQVFLSNEAHELSVLPRYQFGSLSRRRGQDLLRLIAGQFALKMRGIGTEVHSLREYYHGDPMKIIHWKASARQDELISKEYELEETLTVLILLNASGSMHGEKFDRGIQIVQELSDLFSQSDHSYAVAVFADEILEQTGYAKGTRQFSLIQRMIFDLYPRNRRPSLKRVVDYYMEHKLSHHLIFLISDLEEPPFGIAKETRRLKLSRNNLIYVNVSSTSLGITRRVAEEADQLTTLSEQIVAEKVVRQKIMNEYSYRAGVLRKELTRMGMQFMSVESQEDAFLSKLTHLMRWMKNR